MKPLFKVFVAAALATATTGCDSFLDINDNPNQLTRVNGNALLASALATTAANYTGGIAAGTNYNSYTSFATGYWGKSGTVSGFSEERTYNYSTNTQQNLWNNTYDNLNDYNLIQKQSAVYPNHAAIARIMKVYNFLLLVDQYGNIPYSQALQAATNTAPAYDNAADIYKDFIVQLKGAVADIDAATAGTAVSASEDIVFRGNMTKWKQFANSLRLRILLRESQTNDAALNTYVQSEMATLQTATDGFITNDVVVQPGYAANSNQQNPFYNRYGFAAGAVNATSEYSFVLPTNYIIAQYVDNNDPRVTQLYRVGKRTINNVEVAGYVGTDLGEANPPGFSGATIASRFLQGGTFLRGANAPTVLMLLSEHLFSKAEAETRGLFTGGNAAAKTDFLDGIKASFIHTYRTETSLAVIVGASLATSSPATPGVAQYNTYIAANAANPNVNFDLAPSAGSLGKQAVILYQKYIAENTVASTEAWADYRRSAQPKFKVSLQSASPRADKLPTRLLYPQTEVSTNQSNIPTGITQFTPIFWDVVD
ncbi:SusD/RagB family nutrient-binding outer membrane lipoprotein [Hymenobacter swuensis]|uniref:SusD/RagB family nutrient-binding outer membrane lipoprotein n=1 Tax=Hymenobacter swuensis DY53 TaxID=1227739 RepID=W8F1H0_9BACT|nr:SusD/RagB family nutrient-binding outer membrane lipoprotein [Hymenobacter swuensis]AHJ98758.1 hypothetical protein Hsw_3163 [Hymenobacter swuensis DY53]